MVASLSGFCGYTAKATPAALAPLFQCSQRAGLSPEVSAGTLISYPMQSASAAHREAQSALLVGALTASKSLKPILVKRPSVGPSPLWAQS